VIPSKNLLRSRWDKLCWNLTFAGIGVAMGGLTCDVIVNDPSLRKLADGLISDIIRVANADILRQHRARHSGSIADMYETPCLDFIDETAVVGELLFTVCLFNIRV
jgi:ketopantoate reductase